MKTSSRLNAPLWLITTSLATILPTAILLLSSQAQEIISAPATIPFYEAESGVNTRLGTAVVQGCPSCSGGMKVGYVGNNAGALQFNAVVASATGSYVLQIRYTNGDPVRTAYLSINGGASTSVAFPSTGGFSTVGSLQKIVQLNAGNNTLTFYNPNNGQWAPDFDRIQLGLASSDFNDDGKPDYPLYNAGTRRSLIRN